MRSDVVKPRRPLFVAMGRTAEEMQKPLVAIVNSQNELVPGHEHLDQVARAARDGVLAAGGTPFEFPAIAICDGWPRDTPACAIRCQVASSSPIPSKR